MQVIKKDNGRFYKPCPECGVEQSYSRKNYAELSLKENKSCRACSNKKPENNQHNGWIKGVLRHSFAKRYKINAAVRGIGWDVSLEYLADLLIQQDFKCALTGWDIHAMDINNPASLDRIDSTLGYIEGNLQWVTSKVNMMKQHYTQEDFLEVCVAVTKNLKEVKW